MKTGDANESPVSNGLGGLQKPEETGGSQGQAASAWHEGIRQFSVLFEKFSFAAALSKLPDGVFVDVNDAWTKLFGYTHQEAIGKTAFDLNINLDAAGRAQLLARLQEEGSAHNIELILRTKSGEYRNFLVNMDAVEINGHKYILNILQDITERKRVEEALQASEFRYRMVADNTYDFESWIDPEGRYLYASPSCQRIYGHDADEFLANPGLRLETVHPEDQATFEQHLLQEATHVTGETEFRIIHTDGTIRWIAHVCQPVFGETGNYLGIRASNRDITDRKQTEEALHEHQKQLQSLNETLEQKVHEKTEEVRRLASDMIEAVQHERYRISHILHDDLQQRIYAIQMQLTFLEDGLRKGNEAAHQEISAIEKQLADILSVTRHLSIDLNPPILRDEGLSHAINWLAAQMRQRYGLVIELEANESFAIADEALHVLLLNCVRELLFNVVKHAHASRAVVTLKWVETDLLIEVRDDGRGFSVKALEKQAGQEIIGESNLQSGLGLTTIRHQLNLFGGYMEIQSEPGAGTRVILIVPVPAGTSEVR